jgi:hypothetical protein
MFLVRALNVSNVVIVECMGGAFTFSSDAYQVFYIE